MRNACPVRCRNHEGYGLSSDLERAIFGVMHLVFTLEVNTGKWWHSHLEHIEIRIRYIDAKKGG
jgi:hypothetical protein